MMDDRSVCGIQSKVYNRFIALWACVGASIREDDVMHSGHSEPKREVDDGVDIF